MARHSKLYKDGPKIEHDAEKGKPAIKKASSTKSDEVDGGTEGVIRDHAGDRSATMHRHVKERMDMHMKHEMEHVHYKGDKAALHKKHHSELKEAHSRHESEIKSMQGRHEKDGGAEGATGDALIASIGAGE